MKIILLIVLAACSSINNPDTSGDGALDKAMRDDNCGLVDKFYNGCRDKAQTEQTTAPVTTPESTEEFER